MYTYLLYTLESIAGSLNRKYFSCDLSWFPLSMPSHEILLLTLKFNDILFSFIRIIVFAYDGNAVYIRFMFFFFLFWFSFPSFSSRNRSIKMQSTWTTLNYTRHYLNSNRSGILEIHFSCIVVWTFFFSNWKLIFFWVVYLMQCIDVSSWVRSYFLLLQTHCVKPGYMQL